MLTLWRNPDDTFAVLSRELDRLVNGGATPATAGWTGYGLSPAADVLEGEGAFQVVLDLPGHDPEAIQIQVENQTLTVQSERRHAAPGDGEKVHRSERPHGTFFRSFALPATVDASRVAAKYEHGVLTLVLPKREEAKARVIQVNAK